MSEPSGPHLGNRYVGASPTLPQQSWGQGNQASNRLVGLRKTQLQQVRTKLTDNQTLEA